MCCLQKDAEDIHCFHKENYNCLKFKEQAGKIVSAEYCLKFGNPEGESYLRLQSCDYHDPLFKLVTWSGDNLQIVDGDSVNVLKLLPDGLWLINRSLEKLRDRLQIIV